MPGCRPATHVGPDFRDELQCGVRPDGIDLSQVRTRKAVERIANLETGFVVAESRLAAWGRDRRFGSTLFRRERTQEGFDFAVTGLDLPLESIKELEVLAQYEKMFSTIVAR